MLTQELSNKEIMFIRLTNIEQEYEKLLAQVQNRKAETKTEKKGFFSSLFGNSNINNNDNSNYSNNNNTKTKFIWIEEQIIYLAGTVAGQVKLPGLSEVAG